VSEYVVLVEDVFDTIVLHVEPPLVDLSIVYPVIADPPLFVGAVQLRLTCDEDAVVAASPVGALGTVIGVALASFELGDVPTEFTALTV
jgi:hypothetical protein